jgi:hypothetical protein
VCVGQAPRWTERGDAAHDHVASAKVADDERGAHAESVATRLRVAVEKPVELLVAAAVFVRTVA